MKTKTLSEEDIQALLARDEGHFFDFKSKDIDGRGLQKIVVAFANADGGEVLVGVGEKKTWNNNPRAWEGFDSPERANSLLQAVFTLSPTIPLKYEFLHDSKSYVLRIHVEKSGQVHSTSDRKVFVRYGAQSMPMTDPQQILDLSYAKGASSFEDQVLTNCVPEIVVDSPKTRLFLDGYSPRTDPLDYLANQNLLEPNRWIPRVAGVLLFAENPSALSPNKCGAKVVRYETREQDPERDHLASVDRLEGCLYELIQSTVSKVTEIMSQVAIWTPTGLGSASYPPEAIWEVIVNAFIHRDYSISDDIQVLLFNDRIEVRSPGRLPGYVRVENILDARYSRNPKIVRTLNWYPNPPNKDLGEGLNTAFQKMKEWGLEQPDIREEGNYVIVTLPHKPLATPADAIFQFLNNHDQITNEQARDLTGIRSENKVKQEFYKLRDKGYLERVPDLQGTRSAWRLTEIGKRIAH